jgi:hypothetical protein
MTPEVSQQPWSLPVSAAEVPEAGRNFHSVPDESVRAAVAKLAQVPGLPRLEATFEVTPFGRDGLHVIGRVAATVEQVCVVSLEPMSTEVEEAIDMLFSSRADLSKNGDSEVEVSLEDGPEPLIDGKIDLGAIATEFLILGIDPYPRKPDAVFEAPAAEDETAHPFAALAALKKSEDRQ